MPQINEPDYSKIQDKTLYCLKTWMPDATEQDEKNALDELKKIWPEVQWTNVNKLIAAWRHAAQHAIDMAQDQTQVEPVKKRRGRPPKSTLTESLKEPEMQLDGAPVNDSIQIE